MNECLLSTFECAQLLGVHESSIKRWCNDEELPFHKTVGGHRRIHFDDLLIFTQKKSIVFSLSVFAPEEKAVFLAQRLCTDQHRCESFYPLAFEWLSKGKTAHLQALIIYLHEELKVPLAILFDDWLNGLIVSLSHLDWAYQSGERRMIEILRESLLIFRYRLEVKGQLGKNISKRVVLAAGNSLVYELDLLANRLLFESHGIESLYLGTGSQVEEIDYLQKRDKATWVVFSTNSSKDETVYQIEKLRSVYDPHTPYYLVISGLKKADEVKLPSGPFLDILKPSSKGELDEWILRRSNVSLF
jgi:excisionase family DNA binding protein